MTGACVFRHTADIQSWVSHPGHANIQNIRIVLWGTHAREAFGRWITLKADAAD